jgi:integrase
MRPNKVYVKRVAGKRYLQLAWIDPDTGMERRRSAGTGRMRDAIETAKQLELTMDRGVSIDGVTWPYFCERYKAEHIAGLKPRSRGDWSTLKDAIDNYLKPVFLSELNAESISRFKLALKSDKRHPRNSDTVAKYLRTLRTALKWAANLRMIHEAPHISMPRQTRSGRTMKGRPITERELQVMIEHIAEGLIATRKTKSQRLNITRAAIASWEHALWVFWYSGIRLSELPCLYWDDPDKLCVVDLDGERPMLRFHQELEKGNRDRLCPMPPDLADYLRNIHPDRRKGRVATPIKYDGKPASVNTVCKVIGAIGKAARVVVSTKPVKYASTHDLRRSFGTRWAPRVQPAVLQKMMRHKHISTTMEFYVEIDANDLADVINKAHLSGLGDPTGDPKAKSAKSRRS